MTAPKIHLLQTLLFACALALCHPAALAGAPENPLRTAKDAYAAKDPAKACLAAEQAQSMNLPGSRWAAAYCAMSRTDSAKPLAQFAASAPPGPALDKAANEWLRQLARSAQWEAFKKIAARAGKLTAENQCYDALNPLGQTKPGQSQSARQTALALAKPPQSCARLAALASATDPLYSNAALQKLLRLIRAGDRDRALDWAGALEGAWPGAAEQTRKCFFPAAPGASEPAGSGAAVAGFCSALEKLRKNEKDPSAFAGLPEPALLAAKLYQAEALFAKQNPQCSAVFSDIPFDGLQTPALDLAMRCGLLAAKPSLSLQAWSRLAQDEAERPDRQKIALEAAAVLQDPRSRQIAASLAQSYGPYGMALRNGQEPSESACPPASPPPWAGEALYLRNAGLDEEARLELAFHMDQNPQTKPCQLAGFFADKAPDLAIWIASRARAGFRYAYPLSPPLAGPIRESAAAAGLPFPMLYGMAWQESRFYPFAQSSAGALGMTQIMPATYRQICQSAPAGSCPDDPFALLSDTKLSLRLGASYLQSQYAALQDPVLALAAYNSGPARAKRWAGAFPRKDWTAIETLPIEETRGYARGALGAAWAAADPGDPLRERIRAIFSAPGFPSTPKH